MHAKYYNICVKKLINQTEKRGGNMAAQLNVQRRKRTPAQLGKKIILHWQLYVLIAPALIYYALFHYWPIYGLQIAFRNFVPTLGITGSKWVGLMHLKRFFNSYYFGMLVRNTFVINLYSLAVGFPVPILLALMINEVERSGYKRLVQTVLYAPHFISTVVLCGMICSFLSPSNGLINMIINGFTGREPVNYLGNPRIFKTIYVLSGVWQSSGWGAIVYIAALAGIDPELHEAATIDGANRLQRMLHINLPGIMPTITIMFILRMGSMMSVGFEKIFLLQNSLNMEASDVISTYVYRIGLQNAQYSFSAAVGLFNSVINFALLLVFNTISKAVGQSRLF